MLLPLDCFIASQFFQCIHWSFLIAADFMPQSPPGMPSLPAWLFCYSYVDFLLILIRIRYAKHSYFITIQHHQNCALKISWRSLEVTTFHSNQQRLRWKGASCARKGNCRKEQERITKSQMSTEIVTDKRITCQLIRQSTAAERYSYA